MDNVKALVEAAAGARRAAYAPYSDFWVGAALLGRSGRIYTGCNVESAAFSPTSCAERTALVKAVSEGERCFEAIAIVAGARGSMRSWRTISHPAASAGRCWRNLTTAVCGSSWPVSRGLPGLHAQGAFSAGFFGEKL